MRALAVPLAIAACVAFASPLHSPLNNPNEGVRVYAAKALVEQGTFAIDAVVARWGYIDDKAKRDGHLYSSKAPLVSLLAAAGYAVVHPFTGDLERPALTRLSRVAGDILPSLAIAWVLWRALRRRLKDAVVAELSLVGMVLGSGVLASLQVLSGHAIAALAPAAALLLARPSAGEDERARRLRLGLVGLLLAAAVGAEYPAILAAAPLGVWVLVEERRRDAILWLILGALPVVIAVAVAHTAMFGAPWRTGYSFLENRQYQEVVAGTLFGIGAPDLGVLRTVLWSPAVGLWFYSPLLLVGALAALAQARRGAERGEQHGEERGGERGAARAVLVASVLLLLFIAGFRGWRGGWSVGPRYVSELIGLWGVPAALCFDRLASTRPTLARAALAALVAVGLLHSGIAGMFFPHLSDVFANPVPEMMLPLVARGFAPSSLPLWLGASPATAALACLLLLFLPFLLALVAVERPSGWRAPLALLAAPIGALLVTLLVDPALARTRGGAGALEARRMMDNWRPEEGNPLLAADPARRPRTLLAIDRARDAFPMLTRDGCAPGGPAPAPRHPPDAALAQALSRAAPGALLVLENERALDLAELVDAAPVAVLRADLERWRGPLPCQGEVLLLRQLGASMPRPLSGLAVKERLPAGAREELLVLQRWGDRAPGSDPHAPPVLPDGGSG